MDTPSQWPVLAGAPWRTRARCEIVGAVVRFYGARLQPWPRDALLGFEMPDEAIVSGIAKTRWPARLQIVRDRPLVIVDGAHNGAAAEALAASLAELLPGRRFKLVIGILNDKDLQAFATSLGRVATRVFACPPKSPRAFDAEEVGAAFRPIADVAVLSSVPEAIDAALAGANPDGPILITGSIYTAGEALEHLGARP